MTATLERGGGGSVDETEPIVIDVDEQPPSRGPAAAASRLDAVLRNEHVKFGQRVACAVLAFLIFTKFVFPAPNAILFQGAVLGSLSALIAVGIVLVYRANRIINFAQGDLGAVAGVLSVSLIVGYEWPFWPALVVGLAAGIALGAVVEFLFVRRFAKAPRLILTVATIGIAQVLAGLQLIIPTWFGYNISPQNFPHPFDFRFEWSPLVFRGSHLLVILTVPFLAVGLSVFFKRTRTGKAVRASAESSDRALLLGIPVKRIGTYVWVIAALLSALAAVLRAPIVGIPIGETLGPTLMLRAMAAAVIGRMENLTVTFFAAIGIGMIEQAVLWETGRTAAIDPVIFALVMIALVVQSRGIISRAVERGQSTWSSIKEVRPIPPELRDVPIVRGTLLAVKVFVAGLLIIVPLGLGPGRVNLMAFGVLTAMLALSLVILTGWAGQISLGQWAFAGFGAAITGTMVQAGWNVFVALVCGALVGAGVSIAVGIPALRIKGLFLAVATLSFALAAGKFFLNREFFGFVPTGRILRPTLFGKFDLESEYTFYYFCLIVLGLVLMSLRSLRSSRTGRVLLAVRENERAVQAYGVNLIRAKLTAFALAGFLAALMGGLLALHQHNMLGSQLAPENNFRLFSLAVVGGLGSPVGVLVSTGVFTAIDFFINTPAVKLATTGFGLLLVLMVFPGGLGGIIYDGRDNLLKRYAERKGIYVPSLVADTRVEDVPPDEEAVLVGAGEGSEHLADREGSS
ncbi:MAG TPA: ABC transporter permease [Acidimicrobiales bacterium]|nr:ABC transporter permease [Acidimicrobiales bacterium]